MCDQRKVLQPDSLIDDMLAIRMTVIGQQQEQQEQQEQQHQQEQQQYHLNHLFYSYYPGSNGRQHTDTTNTNSTQQHEARAMLGHNQIAVQQRMHQGSNEERGKDWEQPGSASGFGPVSQASASGIAGIASEPEQVRRRAKREACRGTKKGGSRRYHHRGQQHRVHQRLREAASSLPLDSKQAKESAKNATTYDGGTESGSDSDTSSCSAPSCSESDEAPNAALPIGERQRYDQLSICDTFGFAGKPEAL